MYITLYITIVYSQQVLIRINFKKKQFNFFNNGYHHVCLLSNSMYV